MSAALERNCWHHKLILVPRWQSEEVKAWNTVLWPSDVMFWLLRPDIRFKQLLNATIKNCNQRLIVTVCPAVMPGPRDGKNSKTM